MESYNGSQMAGDFGMKKFVTRILIVDDSIVIRNVLSRELSKDDELEVVGTAGDPYVAHDKIIELNPDLIILDFNMPGVDSVTFLKNLRRYYHVPIIVISAPTPLHALEAKRAGAVDLIYGPKYPNEIKIFAYILIKKIKSLLYSNMNQAFTIPDIYKQVAIDVFEDEIKTLTGVPSKVPLNRHGAFFAVSNPLSLQEKQPDRDSCSMSLTEKSTLLARSKRLFIN